MKKLISLKGVLILIKTAAFFNQYQHTLKSIIKRRSVLKRTLKHRCIFCYAKNAKAAYLISFSGQKESRLTCCNETASYLCFICNMPLIRDE